MKAPLKPAVILLLSVVLGAGGLAGASAARASTARPRRLVIRAGCRMLGAERAAECMKSAGKAMEAGQSLGQAIREGCRSAGDAKANTVAFTRQQLFDSAGCMKRALDVSGDPVFQRIVDRCDLQASGLGDDTLQLVSRAGCYEVSLVAGAAGG